jgi:hypothetical protein
MAMSYIVRIQFNYTKQARLKAVLLQRRLASNALRSAVNSYAITKLISKHVVIYSHQLTCACVILIWCDVRRSVTSDVGFLCHVGHVGYMVIAWQC